MDIQTLAAQLAALLLPALPSLLKAAGEKAAETLGEETVKTLWEKLKSRGRVAQAAEVAAEMAAKLPDNPAAKDTLAHEIAAVLQASPLLAQELAQLLGQSGNVQDRSVHIKGNVSGSVINTGDNNTITR
jgi:uroporphyrinogen-III synthase